MDEIKKELQAFPSHFILEGIETLLSVPKMRCMKERILEGIQSDLEPDCHEMARDRNLRLFLDYKLSDICESCNVMKDIIKTTKTYPKDMIALANLAWIYIETNDCEEAEKCVKHLGCLEVWSKVYADAELAYTYVRMGPKFCLKGRDLFEKVIDFRSHYPGIEYEEPPPCLDKLKVVWSYGIILANQRILTPCVFGELENFDRGRNGDPEKIMTRSCALLEKVVSSEFEYYVSHAWLNLRKSFIDYDMIRPTECRTLQIEDLTGGLTLDACLDKAVQANMGDCHALLMIGSAYRKWPLKDLYKCESFLQKALNSLDKNPAVYYQLALLCMDKWLKVFRSIRNNPKNVRDPGNLLLAEAIGHLKKAIEHSQQCVLFHTDLARCKFSYAADPISMEEKEDILATINHLHFAIRRYGEAPKSDQAYAYLHVGLIHEAFGNLKKSRNFLKQSVQMAVDCGMRANAFPILEGMIKKACRENPGVETYTLQAELYEMVKEYSKAIKAYKTIQRMGDKSSAILKKLAENLCRVGQYMDARQCLKLLLSSGSDPFQTGESRSQFIDVCLRVARQYMDDNERAAAANIYQELITDMMPQDVPAAYSKVVVVLSSEHKHDDARTESFIKLLREDLGFNEDSCKLPYENVEGFGKHYNDFIFGYIKKTWCCVVHLTDVLVQDNVFMTTVFRRSADFLLSQPFRGHMLIIDDLTDSESEENQATLEPFHCFPKVKYADLFGDDIDAASTCEMMVKGLLYRRD